MIGPPYIMALKELERIIVQHSEIYEKYRECKFCNKIFEPNTRRQVFCSKLCLKRKENKQISIANKEKILQKDMFCMFCKIPINYTAKRSNKKFCSISCRQAEERIRNKREVIKYPENEKKQRQKQKIIKNITKLKKQGKSLDQNQENILHRNLDMKQSYCWHRELREQRKKEIAAQALDAAKIKEITGGAFDDIEWSPETK